MSFLDNIYDLKLGSSEFGQLQDHFLDSNIESLEFEQPDYYFGDSLFEKFTLNLSNCLAYTDAFFKIITPKFFDIQASSEIYELRCLIIFLDILIIYNKNLAKILCSSRISNILGHGFLAGRKGSSILAYYCSLLAPLSNVKVGLSLHEYFEISNLSRTGKH